MRGASPITPGDHVLTWTLTKTGRKEGTGVLDLDGTEIGRVDIPRIIRGWMPFDGLDVGCNNVGPVATTYESPFRFTGEIDKIVVDLLDETPGPDADVEMRTEMGKQ